MQRSDTAYGSPRIAAHGVSNLGVFVDGDLTVSSVMRGVFEIAGTSSPFQTGLMIAGTLMWVGGVLCYIISIVRL